MFTPRIRPLLAAVAVLALALAACVQPTPVVVEQEKPVTVVVEKQVVVSPTPEPTPDRSKPRSGGTLTIAFPVDAASLDPAVTWGVPAWQSMRGVLFTMLYTWDINNELIPDVAEDFPSVSDDGLVYTVQLKQGIKFCNGRELVAKDVKYSYERACWPETGGWGGPFLAIIDGVQAVLDGEEREISGIKILDDYALEFTLTRPLYNFVQKTGMTNFAILPQEEVDKLGEEFARQPAGAGPFCIKEWVPEERMVFERNPYYGEWHDGRPYIDELVYTFGASPEVALLKFERGEVDVLGPPEAGQSPIPSGELPTYVEDPRYFSEGGLMLNAVDVQSVEPPLDNKLVRQAISYALDREAFIRIIEHGRGMTAVGLWTPADPAFRPGRDPLSHDPERAKELLAEAGYPDGVSLTFSYSSESWPAGEKFGSLLKNQLAQVGITLDLEDLASSVLRERRVVPGGLQLGLFGWSPDYPDPYDMYSWAFSCFGIETKTNRRFYCDPAVEDMVFEAEKLTDNAKRLERYWEVEDRLLDDMIVVPVYYPIWDTVVNPRVGGFKFHPLFVFWPEEYWIVE